ncbi:MAG: metal ABC transporter substrate-binding protein [Acinetobacter sp.]|nr:metal ABC transporter substrate-binding protein [Acinetobacter sp.]
MIFMLLGLTWATSIHAKSLVVTSYPIYLIAQEITQGIEKPELLLENQTGHDIQITPMHRKKIQDASLVLWLGKEHEAPLQKMLKEQKSAIAILDAGVINRLPQRHVRGGSIANTVDTHVWLDPNHAVRIGFFIAILRSQQSPAYKDKYWANAQRFAKEMFQAAQRYQQRGTPQPYWAYHDAYQYLERAMNLKFAGAMTADTHTAPTPTQLKYLDEHRPQKKMCLLAEGHAQARHYQHLEPIIFHKVDETLQGEQKFVDAWQKLAQGVQRCVQQSKM